MRTKSSMAIAASVVGLVIFGIGVHAATQLPRPTPTQAAKPTTRAGNGSGSHGNDNGHGRALDILSFDAMYGVDGPFIGETNAVRGIVGDELPWAVESVRGSLDSSGRLRIRVRGLVFKNAPSVPPEIVGTNDETDFRAAVSCLTEGTSTTPEVNVVTQGFPASTSGDSDIDAHVELPNPCVAPIVLILAGSEDKWFAITGIETEGD